jgi:hypothetical protein
MRSVAAGVLGLALYLLACALFAVALLAVAGLLDVSGAVAALFVFVGVAACWTAYDRDRRRRTRDAWASQFRQR